MEMSQAYCPENELIKMGPRAPTFFKANKQTCIFLIPYTLQKNEPLKKFICIKNIIKISFYLVIEA
jgi:hypothetical protein